MNRRRLLLLPLLSLAACRKAPPRNDLLPPAVGTWKRTALNESPPPSAPAVIPAASIHRVFTAVYEGGGRLDVVLYDLTSSAAALDAVQRWRPAADTVFLFQDQYFVTVHHQTADRQALNAFIRDLNQHLKPKP